MLEMHHTPYNLVECDMAVDGAEERECSDRHMEHQYVY